MNLELLNAIRELKKFYREKETAWGMFIYHCDNVKLKTKSDRDERKRLNKQASTAQDAYSDKYGEFLRNFRIKEHSETDNRVIWILITQTARATDINTCT